MEAGETPHCGSIRAPRLVPGHSDGSPKPKGEVEKWQEVEKSWAEAYRRGWGAAVQGQGGLCPA